MKCQQLQHCSKYSTYAFFFLVMLFWLLCPEIWSHLRISINSLLNYPWFLWRQCLVIKTLTSLKVLLAGDLCFFASSPTLPHWYLNLPLFTSTNIEYLFNTWRVTTLSRVIILENSNWELIRHPWKTKIKHQTDCFRRFL